jgi:hypothetical protein
LTPHLLAEALARVSWPAVADALAVERRAPVPPPPAPPGAAAYRAAL